MSVRTLAAISTVAAIVGSAVLFGAASASATTTCGLPGVDGVVHCSDGSHEYVDDRGHLIREHPDGSVTDLPPATLSSPWY